MLATEAPQAWKNRILGHRWVDPADLLANPFNARRHAAFQAQAVEHSLDVLGWVDEVKVNVNTQHVVDGHLRITLAMRRGEPVPVCDLDLTPAEERDMLAWYDRTTELAQWDADMLKLLRDDGVDLSVVWTAEELARVFTVTPETPDPTLDLYTHKILSPHYEPSADVPPLTALFDTTRTQELLDRIAAAPELPEDVGAFLRAAAMRHTVFNFKRIADYYASAPAAVQTLMEESALVILDYDDAVKLGYVKLVDTLMGLQREDYGDAA